MVIILNFLVMAIIRNIAILCCFAALACGAVLEPQVKPGAGTLGLEEKLPRLIVGDHEYLFESNIAETWASAKLECLRQGFQLVSVESKLEDDAIIGYILTNIGNGKNFWTSGQLLGGTWYWDATDQPVTYTNWKQGEPNNLGREPYIQYRWEDQTIEWNNDEAGTACYFICERKIVV